MSGKSRCCVLFKANFLTAAKNADPLSHETTVYRKMQRSTLKHPYLIAIAPLPPTPPSTYILNYVGLFFGVVVTELYNIPFVRVTFYPKRSFIFWRQLHQRLYLEHNLTVKFVTFRAKDTSSSKKVIEIWNCFAQILPSKILVRCLN